MAESTAAAAVIATITCKCGKQTEEHLYHRETIFFSFTENCSCGSDCKCVGQQCAEGCCTCVCRGCDGNQCSCGDDCRCGKGCCETAVCKKCSKRDQGSN